MLSELAMAIDTLKGFKSFDGLLGADYRTVVTGKPQIHIRLDIFLSEFANRYNVCPHSDKYVRLQVEIDGVSVIALATQNELAEAARTGFDANLESEVA